MAARFARWYDSALQRRPYFVQIVTTGVLFAAGDVIAQDIVERVPRHDFARTARQTSYGLIVAGPSCAAWYRFLEKYVVTRSRGSTLIARVAMDQLVFAPTFIATFFTVMGFLERRPWPSIRDGLVQTFPNALINNYKVWPAVQLANFMLVPLNYRLLVVNTVATGWNSYLSVANRRAATLHVDERN
ncbi:hypothetical protein BJ742DRAFT_34558 [Cladochytrium replicatum]|nr:hypothetical protein BJ742DRAFT_34558 [Cladochytrium replicatum]